MRTSKPVVYDIHHRKAKSRGGNSKPRNLSRVPRHLHVAYHKLFTNMQPDQIAALLNETWVDPDFILIAVRREQ